jgi:hypothetical protein
VLPDFQIVVYDAGYTEIDEFTVEPTGARVEIGTRRYCKPLPLSVELRNVPEQWQPCPGTTLTIAGIGEGESMVQFPLTAGCPAPTPTPTFEPTATDEPEANATETPDAVSPTGEPSAAVTLESPETPTPPSPGEDRSEGAR